MKNSKNSPETTLVTAAIASIPAALAGKLPSSFSIRSGTVMSAPEKEILSRILPVSERLPYPTHPLKMAYGPDAEEYEIPDEDREAVLQELYPFEDCPDISETKFDLHAQRNFLVKDFRVIRECHRNMLVSPYYPLTGGMVLDWLPVEPECDEESECDEEPECDEDLEFNEESESDEESECDVR